MALEEKENAKLVLLIILSSGYRLNLSSRCDRLRRFQLKALCESESTICRGKLSDQI